MSKMIKTRQKKAIADTATAEDAKARTKHQARCATMPSVSAALVVEAFSAVGEQDLSVLTAELSDHNGKVQEGDLRRAESMLISQAHALQSIFVSMARRSAVNAGQYMGASDTYMRMALRAQNQCRMTLETLATIKNPPVIFAKQANIAAGHQQVNNGSAPRAHAAESQPAPNEKEAICHDSPQTLDISAASGTGQANQADQALAAGHRAKNRGR